MDGREWVEYQSLDDKWLLTPFTHKVQLQVKIMSSEPIVRELFNNRDDWVYDEWKRNISYQKYPNEQKRNKRQNHWVLSRKGPNGIFTIQSAYHLIVNLKRKVQGNRLTRDNSSKIWKLITDLRVSSIIKVFMWKALSEILIPWVISLRGK